MAHMFKLWQTVAKSGKLEFNFNSRYDIPFTLVKIQVRAGFLSYPLLLWNQASMSPMLSFKRMPDFGKKVQLEPCEWYYKSNFPHLPRRAK